MSSSLVTLCLCGDVMTGRGVDQALPYPRDAQIVEPGTDSALVYLKLAEEAHGPISVPVDFAYVWGDALREFYRSDVDMRIVNLETSITTSRTFWPKAINYAMSPRNVPCLSAARIDCCVLANNHVMDFGYSGLAETLRSLENAHIAVAGAGVDLARAQEPAVKVLSPASRIVVFAFASTTSGVPDEWRAGPGTSGVDLLRDLSWRSASEVARRIAACRRSGDVVVAAIHWGENWGYQVGDEERAFAHALIDEGGVDIVFGHSSHHPKAIERYANKLILYGCGDFLDDYEGISGYEEFRSDLVLMYVAAIDGATGRLAGLTLAPFAVRRFRLTRASNADTLWLRDTLDRESARFGAQFVLHEDGKLALR